MDHLCIKYQNLKGIKMKNRFMLLKYLEMVDDQIINYMVKKVLICLNMRQLFKIIIAYISL